VSGSPEAVATASTADAIGWCGCRCGHGWTEPGRHERHVAAGRGTRRGDDTLAAVRAKAKAAGPRTEPTPRAEFPGVGTGLLPPPPAEARQRPTPAMSDRNRRQAVRWSSVMAVPCRARPRAWHGRRARRPGSGEPPPSSLPAVGAQVARSTQAGGGEIATADGRSHCCCHQVALMTIKAAGARPAARPPKLVEIAAWRAPAA
jgi:hypothetical protein